MLPKHFNDMVMLLIPAQKVENSSSLNFEDKGIVSCLEIILVTIV